MLKLVNISSGYGTHQVLFDVTFEVGLNEVVLLAGSNGSGKSTLLKTIYGILPQWGNGSIIFDGHPINKLSKVKLLEKGLIYIPQKENLFEDLTIQENLQIAGLTLNRKVLRSRIESVLLTFSALRPHLNKIPGNISGGERKLLTIAMALLHHPKMILFDEPFAGLSKQNIILVTESLKFLNRNLSVTLLIVEHLVKESLNIANRIIGLKLGKVFSEIEVTANFKVDELYSTFV